MWETRSVFHISMPHFLQQDGLRCRWPVAERRMRSHRVVVHSPPLDYHLRLLQRVEDLALQTFIAQLAIEAFAVAIFPRTARLDVHGLSTHPRQPLPQPQRNKLGSIVGPYVLRYSMPQHQVGQDFNQVVAVQPPCHPDRQTLPRILVDQRQQPQGSAVVRAGAYKIVGPNVILALRPQSHATAIIQPQPASRPLFLRYFQPFAAPDPLHPVFAYRPTRCAQQSRNPPIAIASVGAGTPDNAAFLATAPTAGTHAAPISDVSLGHAVPRNAAVQGLEVSLRHV